MILGTDKLLELVKTNNLVENLSERELNNPEGAGFDFRLGSVHKLIRKSDVNYFLGEKERQTPHSEIIMEYDKDNKKILTLKPGEYYLVSTVEKINTPKWLAPTIRPRTTIFRSGIILLSADISPGYCGPLTVGLYNASQQSFDIELGARIMHLRFHLIDGKTNSYQGQWQGGRISTEEKEEQV